MLFAAGVALTIAAAIVWRRRLQRAQDEYLRTALLAAAVPPEAPAKLSSPILALTPQTRALLAASADTVTSASDVFYSRLFELEPQLQSLFGDPTTQAGKFGSMTRWIVGTLGTRDGGSLADALKSLGQRHIKYGARLAHLLPVKRALLETVASLHYGSALPGAAQAAEVQRAWEALMYAIVGEMGPVLLLHESLSTYHYALADELAAPAGGTATAIAGAQGAALLSMAVRLTRQPPTGWSRNNLEALDARLDCVGDHGSHSVCPALCPLPTAHCPLTVRRCVRCVHCRSEARSRSSPAKIWRLTAA
jgi:hemoglobin-like flavoprotein